MAPGIRSSTWLAGLALVAILALAAALPGDSSSAPLNCAQFSSQGDAQAVFAELSGTPGHTVGSLDPDRDGIACEGLPAPYAGYATIGYNRAGGFLFGSASMPAAPSGKRRFPCLQGNRRGPEGPRRVSVFRAREGDDRPVLAGIGAEARPESGRLVWKAPRATLAPGRYYAAFAEPLPLTPYGRSECPGFRTRETPLPAPRLSR